MKSSLAIALSGGVDSLVAAALLKEQGHRLIGLHFVTGYETNPSSSGSAPSDSAVDDADTPARRTMDILSHQLGIPVHIIDLRADFQSQVVNYFVGTYASGKTPNPCLICNPTIKFGILLSKAKVVWGFPDCHWPLRPHRHIRRWPYTAVARHRQEEGAILFSVPPDPGPTGIRRAALGNHDQSADAACRTSEGPFSGNHTGEPGCLLYKGPKLRRLLIHQPGFLFQRRSH